MTGLEAAKRVFATDGGAGTPSIERLGFQPRAALLWWTRQESEGVERGNRGGLGFWTPDASASIAWASDDGAAPTRTGQVMDQAPLVGLAGTDGEIAMRAAILGLDPEGLTLTWSTKPDQRWIVHLLALGGPALTRAQIEWTMSPPTSGRADLDLAEIRPDLLFFASAGVESLSAAVRGLSIGLGAASLDGQASAGYASRDGAPAGDVGGAQRADTAVLLVADREELALRGSVRLGSTKAPSIEWSTAGPRRHPICCLALEGLRCRVGTAVSPKEPGCRRTQVGFRPDALFFFSWGLPKSRQTTDIGRLCVGGAASHESGCAGWDDRDWNAQPSTTHVCSSTRDVVIVTNTQNGSIHASAALLSIDDHGFELDWTASDGKEREVVYIALTAATRSGLGPRACGLTRRLAAFIDRSIR
jgi:hypothetical protein